MFAIVILAGNSRVIIESCYSVTVLSLLVDIFQGSIGNTFISGKLSLLR